jgi:hypothetical protein
MSDTVLLRASSWRTRCLKCLKLPPKLEHQRQRREVLRVPGRGESEHQPITGQRLDMEPIDTEPEMTEVEKEREAEIVCFVREVGHLPSTHLHHIRNRCTNRPINKQTQGQRASSTSRTQSSERSRKGGSKSWINIRLVFDNLSSAAQRK